MFHLSRFDAALTCPEPWSHVNRSVKLLEVNVCHLTQFAFFWSFHARHGLILFDKVHSSKYIARSCERARIEIHSKCLITSGQASKSLVAHKKRLQVLQFNLNRMLVHLRATTPPPPPSSLIIFANGLAPQYETP